MSKIGSDDPFEYIQHKLCPKEGSGIKVSIWFMTIKSQKFPWIIYVKMVCHILLESIWQGLQLYFMPHFNWRSTQEVIGFQSDRSPNFKNFKIFDLGV
jgi:hypothetical protein